MSLSSDDKNKPVGRWGSLCETDKKAGGEKNNNFLCVLYLILNDSLCMQTLMEIGMLREKRAMNKKKRKMEHKHKRCSVCFVLNVSVSQSFSSPDQRIHRQLALHTFLHVAFCFSLTKPPSCTCFLSFLSYVCFLFWSNFCNFFWNSIVLLKALYAWNWLSKPHFKKTGMVAS